MQEVFEKIIEKLEEMIHPKQLYFCKYARGGCKHLDNDDKDCMECVVENAIEIVKQEAEQYKLYDTISIHTNGLEEEIRCAVCTNRIKSDTGCDGGCCVDENLVKKICDVIHKFECKSYQPKGE